MNSKFSDVKSLILVDLEKFNSLTEKSKKLSDLQRQQITDSDDCPSKKDITEQSLEEENKINEQMIQNKRDSELENTIYAKGGQQDNAKNDETGTTELHFENWFKVL